MEIAIRPAQRGDAPHVAVLIDLAGHGIEVDVWLSEPDGDGSPLAAARRIILVDTASPYHLSRAHMAVVDGEVAGAVIGGLVHPESAVPKGIPDYLQPLLELESRATGCWAIIGVAVYPEFRGMGLARRLLQHAKDLGRQAGATGLSLVVEDTNRGALALYTAAGFKEQERRPWLAYGKRSGPQHWVLMTRPL